MHDDQRRRLDPLQLQRQLGIALVDQDLADQFVFALVQRRVFLCQDFTLLDLLVQLALALLVIVGVLYGTRTKNARRRRREFAARRRGAD